MEPDEVTERAAKAARAKGKLKKFQAKNNALSKLAKSEFNFDSGATTPTSTVGARSDGGEISRPNSVQPISSVLEEDRRYEPRNDLYERKFVSPEPIRNRLPSYPNIDSISPSSSNTPSSPSQTESLLHSQQQTIALLVSDKHSLTNRIRELSEILTEKENDERDLEVVGRQLNDKLREVQRLTAENQRLAEGDRRGRDEVARIGREAELSRHNLISLQSQVASKDALLTETLNKLHELQSSNSLPDLESKLRSKSERADALELELSKARAVYLKLKSEKEAVEKAEELARSQTEEVKTAYENLRIEKEARERDVVLMKSKLVEITQLLEEDRRVLQDQAATLLTFKSGASSSSEQLSVALRRISHLEETLAASEKKVEASNSRRDGLEKENVALLTSLEELRGKVVSLTNDQVAASDKNTLLQRILRDRDTAMKSVHSELDELEKQLRLSREGSIELQARLTFLEDILAQSKKEVAITVESKEQLEQEVKSHLATIAELQTSVESLTASRDEQISLVQTLEYTVSNLEEEVGSAGNLDQEVSNLKQQYSELYAEHTEATAKLADLSSSTGDHQQSLDSTRSDLSKAQTALTEAQESHAILLESSSQQIASLSKELQDFKSTSQSYSTSLASLQQEAASHLETIAQQQADLASLTSTSLSHSERADKLAESFSKSESAFLATSATLAQTQIELDNVSSALQISESARSQLQSTVDSMNASMDELHNQFSELKATLAAKESKIHSLEGALEVAEQEADTATMDLAEFEKINGMKVKELESEIAASSTSSKSLMDQILSLEKQLDDITEEKNQLEELSNQKLASSNNDSNNIRITLENDLEQLRSHLSAIESQQKSTLSELDSVKSHSASLEQSLTSTQQDLNHITSIKDELSFTNDSLTSSLEELRASVTTLNDTSSTHSDLAATLSLSLEQKEVAARAAHSAGELLKKELESLKEEVQVAERARKDAEELLAASRGSVESSTSLLESVTNELQDSKKEILSLEQGLKSTSDELRSSVQEKEELISTSTELRRSVESTQIQVEKITSARNDLEEQISSLQKALREKDSTIAESESGVAKEVEAANQLVRDRNVALSAANRRASASERELKAIMASGSEKSEEEGILRSTISKLEEEVIKLRGGVGASSNEVASLSEELERHVVEVQELKQEVEVRKEEIEESTAALKELKEVFARAQEDLISKDAEIEEILSRVDGGTTPIIQLNGATPDPSIYDRDYVDSLQQTHELDLSTARAQIRALEERIFAAEDSGYQMMKANGDLKSQVASMTEVVAKEKENVRRKEREVEALRAAEHDHHEHNHSNSRASVSPPPRSSPGRVLSPPRSSASQHNHSHASHSHASTSSVPSSHSHTAPPLQALFSPSLASSIPSSPSLLPPTSPSLLPTSPSIRLSPRAYAHRRASSHLPAATESLLSGQESSFPIPSPDQRLHVATSSYDLPTPSSLPKDLSRSTRHARNASLSVLKTRMEDELGVDDLLQETLLSVAGGADQNEVHRRMGRSAVLGDNFVWCSSCNGDLIIV